MKRAIVDVRRAVFRVLLAILIALLCAPIAPAEEITVAAAADLQFALREIAQNYEHKTGNHVKLTFGSSGALAAQIQNGAPFDVFFSADVNYPEKLAKIGAADGKTLVRYARGILVVWASPSFQGPLQAWIQPLRSESAEKIAIANPSHAPYGRAAVEALRKADLYERVAGKLVTGENVSQAAQFAESGNAQVALLPLSLASVGALKEKGRYIRVPDNMYAPIVQAAVVTKQARNATVAQGFLRFVVHDGIVTLRKYGFEAQELNPPPVVQP